MSAKILLASGLLTLVYTTSVQAEPFKMGDLSGAPGCQLLYYRETPVLRFVQKEGRLQAMGIGKCPRVLPSDAAIDVWTMKTIQFDMGGRLARAFSNPNKNANNVVTKVVIRKGEPALGKGGAYRFFFTKLK